MDTNFIKPSVPSLCEGRKTPALSPSQKSWKIRGIHVEMLSQLRLFIEGNISHAFLDAKRLLWSQTMKENISWFKEEKTQKIHNTIYLYIQN